VRQQRPDGNVRGGNTTWAYPRRSSISTFPGCYSAKSKYENAVFRAGSASGRARARATECRSAAGSEGIRLRAAVGLLLEPADVFLLQEDRQEMSVGAELKHFLDILGPGHSRKNLFRVRSPGIRSSTSSMRDCHSWKTAADRVE